MDAHRISSPASSKRTSPSEKPVSSARGNLVRVAVQCVVSRIFPWCKDHIVSAVVLLVFPFAIGMYYWGQSEFESSPIPGYLNRDRREDSPKFPQALLSQQQASAGANVPGVSSAPDSLPALTFAHVSEESDALPPLPIAVDSPKPLSRANEGPTLPWPGNASPTPTPVSAPAQSVWLTGSIESVEAAPDLIQNASRVHELTMPSRN